MKLIRKISGKSNNLHIYNDCLYFRDESKSAVCIDINDYSIIWKGEPDTFDIKFSSNFILNRKESNEKGNYLSLTKVINKNTFQVEYKDKINVKLVYKNDMAFVDYGYVKAPNRYGLYDFDKKFLYWKNDIYIPYDAFIKGDYIFALRNREMRLEMIEAMTGKMLWSISTEIDRKPYFDPQNIIDVVDGELVMTYDYKKIVGIDLESGKINWEWSLEGVIEEIPDFKFDSNNYKFIKYKGKYFFGYGRLLSMDLGKREIKIESEREIEVRGKKKNNASFHELFLFGDKLCFYGLQYERRLGAHYSVIGIYDMVKKKVLDFADDEFPGRLRFAPALHENRLFQQDDDGNIHIFELELDD